MLNPENYMDLGVTAVVAVAAFWAIIQIVKIKKQPLTNGIGKAVLEQLKIQNENHLHELSEQMVKICDSMNEGNNRIVDSINEGNRQMIQLLGEIKGRLK